MLPRSTTVSRPRVARRVIALTNQAPPHEATHWTAPAMAKAVGISPSSVRRMWQGHGLQPHRVRAFKISNDPKFADKLKEVVGLYVDRLTQLGGCIPLCVWCSWEQTQIFRRRHVGRPANKGRGCA